RSWRDGKEGQRVCAGPPRLSRSGAAVSHRDAITGSRRLTTEPACLPADPRRQRPLATALPWVTGGECTALSGAEEGPGYRSRRSDPHPGGPPHARGLVAGLSGRPRACVVPAETHWPKRTRVSLDQNS